MNKKLYGLLAMLGLAVAVAGCGGNTDSTPSVDNSNTDSNNSVNSEVVSNSSDVNEEDEYYALPDWQPTKNYFSGNFMSDYSDIEINRAFMTGADYSISYSLNTLPSDPSKEWAVSSNEKVFTVEKVGSIFKIHAVHAGRAYIRIYDSNDIIRYCALITVEDAIPINKMEEYLVYDCEYWVDVTGGWSDYFVLNFNEGGQYTISGMLSGIEFAPITGTYEFLETINNGKEYRYIFTDTDVAVLSLTGFDVASNGKFMYLQSVYGTDAIMLPKDLAEAL